MEVSAGAESQRDRSIAGTLEKGQLQRFTKKALYRLRRATEERRRQGGRATGRPRPERNAEGRRGEDRLGVSRPRAAIVVTGSELVRGERTDRNGPFYAHEALSLGLVPDRILIVGDDPRDLEAALRAGSEAEVCLVSGGLGPTHDDRTVELVARVAGVSLRVDETARTGDRGSSRDRSQSASAGRTRTSPRA